MPPLRLSTPPLFTVTSPSLVKVPPEIANASFKVIPVAVAIPPFILNEPPLLTVIKAATVRLAPVVTETEAPEPALLILIVLMVTVLLIIGYLDKLPGIFAMSPAAGATFPNQLVPVFQSVLVVPVQVFVPAIDEEDKNVEKIRKANNRLRKESDLFLLLLCCTALYLIPIYFRLLIIFQWIDLDSQSVK